MKKFLLYLFIIISLSSIVIGDTNPISPSALSIAFMDFPEYKAETHETIILTLNEIKNNSEWQEILNYIPYAEYNNITVHITNYIDTSLYHWGADPTSERIIDSPDFKFHDNYSVTRFNPSKIKVKDIVSKDPLSVSITFQYENIEFNEDFYKDRSPIISHMAIPYNNLPKEFSSYLYQGKYFVSFGNVIIWDQEKDQTLTDRFFTMSNKKMLSFDNKGVYCDHIIAPNKNFAFYIRYSFPIIDPTQVLDVEFKSSNIAKITYKNNAYEYWLIEIIPNNIGREKIDKNRLIYINGNPFNMSVSELSEYINKNKSKFFFEYKKHTYKDNKEIIETEPFKREPKYYQLKEKFPKHEFIR